MFKQANRSANEMTYKSPKFARLMPDLSLPTANLLANIGNFTLILGALLVLIGTWLTIWAGGTKERFADERISGNERLTEIAKKDAVKAVEETEKIRETNLKLSIQLESERSARIKIEQGLASRSISADKKPLLVEEIKKIQPPPIVKIERLIGDTEARHFGDELVSCFELARIKIIQDAIGMSPGFPDGLTIVGAEPVGENRLAAALRAAGFSPAVVQSAVPQDVSEVVLVGLKPPSF